jgi:hypothetical protein
MFEPACAFGHATAITAGSIFPRLFSANSAVPLLAVPETDAGAATVLVDELDAGGLESASDCVKSRATRPYGYVLQTPERYACVGSSCSISARPGAPAFS